MSVRSRSYKIIVQRDNKDLTTRVINLVGALGGGDQGQFLSKLTDDPLSFAWRDAVAPLASQIPTSETGVSVQDELDRLSSDLQVDSASEFFAITSGLTAGIRVSAKTGEAWDIVAAGAGQFNHPAASPTVGVNGISEESSLTLMGGKTSLPNNSSAFARAINRVFDEGGYGRVSIPSGRWLIGSKVSIPYRSAGSMIEGEGIYNGNVLTPSRIGGYTALMWSGPQGGTLLGGIGNLGTSIKRIAFCGQSSVGSPKAGILFHCEQDVTDAFGSGNGVLEQLAFSFADVGIQMGTVVTDHNCADWLMMRMSGYSLGTLMRVVNIQGVNYTLIQPSMVLSDRMLHLVSGGNVYITNAQIALSGGTGPEQWIFDLSLNDNRCHVDIRGLRLEQDCKQTLYAKGMGLIRITGYEEAQANQSVTMVKVEGPTVHIEDSRLITRSVDAPHFMVNNGTGGFNGKLFIAKTHFDVDTFDLNEWVRLTVGVSNPVQIRDSYYGQGGQFHIPFTNSHLEYGYVRHYLRTIDATANQNVLFDGGKTTRGVHNVCRLPVETVKTLEVTISAREVGGAQATASFKRRLVVSSSGSAATIVNIQTIGVDYNPAGWAAIISGSGTLRGINAQVTGAAETTIDWVCIISEL